MQPIFKSSRAQSAAVAVATAFVLLGATGLAYLQTPGEAPYGEVAENPRQIPSWAHPAPTGQAGTLLLDLPKDWSRRQTSPGSVTLTDPHRPTRRLTVLTIQLNQQTPPRQLLQRFIAEQVDPTLLKTIKQAAPAIEFKISETGLIGAEFIGLGGAADRDDARPALQLLLACLTPDGNRYWLLSLTDQLDPGADPEQALRENIDLIRSIYRSARFQTQ